MFKFLHRFFNYDKIEKLNETIDTYKERNEQLEKEIREYKGYKLKYEVAKMYVEDDEALLEICEAVKKSQDSLVRTQIDHRGDIAAQQQRSSIFNNER